jgi:uncharacterized protein YndB with AHSA1/START domain
MASLRYERRISAPADRVWEVVRRPDSIAEWFPGIVSCSVEGSTRTITTASGLTMDEHIVCCDDQLRRFAYRVTTAPFTFHLGVIDVFELAPEEALCVYSTTAEPDTLALLIAGGTVGALDEIARRAENRVAG